MFLGMKMSPAHFILSVLSCIALYRATDAVYEDCQTPPPVDHARAQLYEDTINHVNTAIYNCERGYVLNGANELICNVDTEEWQGDPPMCLRSKVSADSERKKKMLAIPEEPTVSTQLAQKLDVSCTEASAQAPEINQGSVIKYERRRRGNKIFLVAYYACNKNYDFERTEVSALFCSSKQWVGELPTCLLSSKYTDYKDDESYFYYDSDYETAEKDDDNAEDLETVPQPAANPMTPPPPPPPVENVELEPQIESVYPTTVESEPELAADSENNGSEQVAMTESETKVNIEDTSAVATVENPAVETVENPTVKQDEQSETDIEPVIVVPVETEEVNTEIRTEMATEINMVVEPTKDPFTPRLLDESCGEDRGGCAHKCERLLFPGENEPRLKCSCNEGYTLDPQNYSSCLDIDECQESNGGCSEICNNLPGSFECACEKGYQIDQETGNTCIDIDECLYPELSAECTNGCENSPGSYRCLIPLNTKAVEKEEEAVEESDIVDSVVEEFAKPEIDPEPSKPSCNPGFVLSMNSSECQDINECNIIVENADDVDHVPHRVCQQLCENTIGSFRCGCRDDYHLLEDGITCAPDKCEDLDNPQLNRIRCDHECANVKNGGYECVCPEGYTLGEDLHSCDVMETACTREQGHERCRPGSCLVSEDNSTFSCLCPPGYTSEIFSCQDIDECEAGTHKCSHNCFNTAGGYQCLCPRGMSLLEPEGLTCVAPDPCAFNNNGCEQLCLSSDNGACTCSKGYILSDDNKSCTDIDECQSVNGGCQQLCRNTPGSYECLCAPGFEPLETEGLSGFCFDIDECATNEHSCEPSMQCENLNGSYTCLCEAGYALGHDNRIHLSSQSAELSSSSLSSSSLSLVCLDVDECSLSNANCSHFCINLPGSFECACPLGFSLDLDGRSCHDQNECLHENGQCAQICVNQPGGFACACQSGFQLDSNGFSCLDIDECANDFGNCSGICINLLGSHTCACERGYDLAPDGHTCQDVDECAGLLAGGCTHECINKPGSYECACPLGHQLQQDKRSCQPIHVECPSGTYRTDRGCAPIECGLGMLIGSNGQCMDMDECQVNNGGCSHLCENIPGSFKCICPAGYQLATNARDCEDVDECAVDNAGCAEICINEPGSFKCHCGQGKRLSFDGHSCYDEVAIQPRAQLPPVPTPAPFPSLGQLPSSRSAPFPSLPPLKKSPIPKPAPFPTLEKSPEQFPFINSSSPAPSSPSFRTLEFPAPRRPLANRPGLPVFPATPAFPGMVRDQCVPFEAPPNSQAHCNRYRHKRKLFYNTRCKVRCNEGYQLIGSEIHSCGATGRWEGEVTKCVRISGVRRVMSPATFCPALPVPRNGVITPASCTRGASRTGVICFLQCEIGFVPVAGMMTSCMNGWTLGSVLECKPLSSLFSSNQMTSHNQIQAPWQQQSFKQQSINHIKPFINCPENVVILLGPQQTKARVILQQPTTNIDYRHVTAFPPWAKHLQGHLPVGTHRISFQAREPKSQQTVGCQTIVTVKRITPTSNQNPFDPRPFSLHEFPFMAKPGQKHFERLTAVSSPLSLEKSVAENLIAEKPSSGTSEFSRIDLGTSTSSYCPPSFEVHLKEHQNLRSVLWEEPRFEGKLLKIFKSSFPGALFGQGDHTVTYEATTTDGQTLKCIFQIHVKAANPAAVENTSIDGLLPSAAAQETQNSLFVGRESYVVCPDKEPVRVTSQQAVNLPVGCSLKNVGPQSNIPSHPKRGLLTSLWSRFANF